MRKIYNDIIRITDKKFERIFTFWFIAFSIMALVVWVIEAILVASHSPQWYDITYLLFCIYGYLGTIRRLKEVL